MEPVLLLTPRGPSHMFDSAQTLCSAVTTLVVRSLGVGDNT